MTEAFLKPGLRPFYAAQPCPFLCWAAAGLVLYRSRHGPEGRGASIEALLSGGDNPWFETCRRFANALVERAARDGVDYDTADEALREENPAFADAVPGLKFEHGDEFFVHFLGARATPLGRRPGALDPRDKSAMKAFIRARAPLVVFHRVSGKVGHLQLVVGFRDMSPHDPNSPAILVFDPEAAFTLRERDGGDTQVPDTIGEHAMLWTLFQSMVIDRLVEPRLYSY